MSPLIERVLCEEDEKRYTRVGIINRTVTVQFVEQRVQQKNIFSLLRDDASSLLLDVVEVPMSIFFPPVCCDSFLTPTMMMIRTR